MREPDLGGRRDDGVLRRVTSKMARVMGGGGREGWPCILGLPIASRIPYEFGAIFNLCMRKTPRVDKECLIGLLEDRFLCGGGGWLRREESAGKGYPKGGKE